MSKRLSEKQLSNEAYIVEAILGKVVKDGITQYEVKWVGYDYTTYEPETNPDIKMLAEQGERPLKQATKPTSVDSRKLSKSKSKADAKKKDEQKGGQLVSLKNIPSKKTKTTTGQKKVARKQKPKPRKPKIQRNAKGNPKTKKIQKISVINTSDKKSEVSQERLTTRTPTVDKSTATPTRLVLKDQATQTEKKLLK